MNIYLKSDEEIISVIDRLIQTKEKEVNLIVPSRAQIWQSSINLKLLKREADNLGKDVTLVVTDDLGAEMAQRIGFAVKKEKDLPVELVKEEEPVLDEVPTFIKDEVEKETEMEIEPKEEQNDKDNEPTVSLSDIAKKETPKTAGAPKQSADVQGLQDAIRDALKGLDK